jgi:hypothetical protein
MKGSKKAGTFRSAGRPLLEEECRYLRYMADCWYRECTGYFYAADPVIVADDRGLPGILLGAFLDNAVLGWYRGLTRHVGPGGAPNPATLGAQQTLPPWGAQQTLAALGAQQTLPPLVRNKPCHLGVRNKLSKHATLGCATNPGRLGCSTEISEIRHCLLNLGLRLPGNQADGMYRGLGTHVKCPAPTFRVHLGHVYRCLVRFGMPRGNLLQNLREGSDWGQCPVGQVGFQVPPFAARGKSQRVWI